MPRNVGMKRILAGALYAKPNAYQGSVWAKLDKIFLYSENNPAYITSPLVHNHTCAKAFI